MARLVIPRLGVKKTPGMLAEQQDELVVDLFIAHQMREAFDARSHQTLGVLQIENVRDGAQTVLVGFVDGRPIEFRSELLLGMVSVVHPNLDEVGMVRGQIPHGRRACSTVVTT